MPPTSTAMPPTPTAIAIQAPAALADSAGHRDSESEFGSDSDVGARHLHPGAAATAASAHAPPPPPSAAASLPGEWDFQADAGKGVIAGTLRFRSTASGLAGVYVGLHGNSTELSNLHATGAGVSFDLVTPNAVWHLDGTLSGDSIDGTFQTADRSIRWTAVRKSAAPRSPTPRS